MLERGCTQTNPSRKSKRLLAKTMGFGHYEDNPRSGIMVDFCLYNLMFCDEQGFTPEKKSAFFSVMKLVFEESFKGQVIAM